MKGWHGFCLGDMATAILLQLKKEYKLKTNKDYGKDYWY
jgi:hypothetical protein